MHILLVEDNPADAFLLTEIFAQKQSAPDLHWVVDGYDALNYVLNRSPYEHAQRPDMILLDLNIPRINGHDVLRQLKSQPDYEAIPIIILTTSLNPLDHSQCKVLGADMCLSKPHGLKEYEELVQRLMSWGGLRVDKKPAGELH